MWRVHSTRYLRCCRQWTHKRTYSTPSTNYCMSLVRKHDYEHYLCCLLLPKSAQSAAFAIRAFNVETAQIHDIVSEKQIGLMRVQFWRDTIDNVFKGSPPKHPVAISLANALKQHGLTKHWFNRLLDTREAELSTAAYLSTSDMEAYADNTFSSLLFLTLETLGIRDVNADHAASHVGRAEGIVTLLRATPYYRTKRTVLIPMDILMRHGASQQDFLKAEVSQSVKDTAYDFASLANAHLQKARSLKDSIPLKARRALLPAVLCEKFLSRIQVVDFDPFAPVLSTRTPSIAFSLLWRAIRRTY